MSKVDPAEGQVVEEIARALPVRSELGKVDAGHAGDGPTTEGPELPDELPVREVLDRGRRKGRNPGHRHDWVHAS